MEPIDKNRRRVKIRIARSRRGKILGISRKKSTEDWSETKKDYENYINSEEWNLKSKKCIAAARYKCEVCSSVGSLQSHHYNYVFLRKEREKDLFCLCERCHKKYHNIHPSHKLPKDNLNRIARLDQIKKDII
jgi:5-methylcytosine-specific restriction endonuclease McrA